MRACNLTTRRRVAPPCRSVSIKVDIDTKDIKHQVAKKLINVAEKLDPTIGKPVAQKSIAPKPVVIEINPDDPWQVRGLKAPLHLEKRYEPKENHPLSKYEVWRYRELERQDLIRKSDKTPQDEHVKTYIKIMYPKKEDHEFLFDSSKLIKSVISTDNTIVVPKDISDGFDFAEFVRSKIIDRNAMNLKTFNKLPFFETYHLHSNRFPLIDNKLEFDVTFNKHTSASIGNRNGNFYHYNIKDYQLYTKIEFNHNKIFIGEIIANYYWKLSEDAIGWYIKDKDLYKEVMDKWLKDRETLPVWYNHVLVTDG